MKAFLSISLALALAGCGVYYSKSQSETISKGVHGTSLALDSGQIQTADKLIKETKKVVLPPKNPITVEAIRSNGKKVIILPESIQGEVVTVDSARYQELLKDKAVRKSLEKAVSDSTKFQKEVERQQQEDFANAIKKDELIKKQEAKISSLVKYRNLVWGVCGLVGLAVAGLVIYIILRIGGKVAV